MGQYVRRVAYGHEVDGKFEVSRWVTDVVDDPREVKWSPYKVDAARYFLAVEAHAVAKEASAMPPRELRGTCSGCEVRVIRTRLRGD